MVGAAYMYTFTDDEEGEVADSVGASSATSNEDSDGVEDRRWGDGGRRWRWPTVGADGVRWCCAYSGGLWWCQKDVIQLAHPNNPLLNQRVIDVPALKE